jgi:hypothetical protein
VKLFKNLNEQSNHFEMQSAQIQELPTNIAVRVCQELNEAGMTLGHITLDGITERCRSLLKEFNLASDANNSQELQETILLQDEFGCVPHFRDGGNFRTPSTFGLPIM